VFVPVRVRVCVDCGFPRDGLIARIGGATFATADAEPVTVSAILNEPVPAPVLTTIVAEVPLVTVGLTFVTFATPKIANTVAPLQAVPVASSVRVMFPECPLRIAAGDTLSFALVRVEHLRPNLGERKLSGEM
jgi:hypothetical protein